MVPGPGHRRAAPGDGPAGRRHADRRLARRPARIAGRTPATPVPLAPPGGYLLDPSPAVTRAGLVAELARSLGAWQIDPMIAFLSSDEPVRTPFARTLRVLESAPWHEKRFARTAARARHRLGRHPQARPGRRRGADPPAPRPARPGAATIVLTSVANRPWGLICARPPRRPARPTLHPA